MRSIVLSSDAYKGTVWKVFLKKYYYAIAMGETLTAVYNSQRFISQIPQSVDRWTPNPNVAITARLTRWAHSDNDKKGKDKPNVGLEPTTDGLRVHRSTD